MSDLTKLTAGELIRMTGVRPGGARMIQALIWPEIRRRLEELEQIKAVSRAKAIEDLHHNSAELIGREELLGRLETLRVRDRNWDSLYTVALERLEKCEAALLKARVLLVNEGDPEEDSEMIAEIDALIGNAARAAMEEKWAT